MYCPYCGTLAPEGASFCSRCGKKFPEIVTIQATPQSAPLPPNTQSQLSSIDQSTITETILDRKQYKAAARKPMNKKKKILIVVLILLVLVIFATGTGLFLWFNNPHRSPEAVAEAYLRAMDSNNAQAVIELIPEQFMDYMIQTYYGTRENLERDIADDVFERYDRMVNGPFSDYYYLSKENQILDYSATAFNSYSEQDLKDLGMLETSWIWDFYEELGLGGIEITHVSITIHYLNSLGEEATRDVSETVLCINNQWYITYLPPEYCNYWETESGE